jgi:AraC-like DNA-binding protein
MPVTVRQTNFNNFEALQDIVQDGRSDIVQLGRGQMSGTIRHIELGSAFGISTGSFSRAMRSRGVLSEQRWMLGMLLGSTNAATTVNFKFAPGDIAIVKPGQERYSRFNDTTSYMSAFITPEELDAFLATQPGAQEALVWRPPVSVLAAAPATAEANIKALLPVLNALTEHGPTLSDDTADFFKRDILELLTAPLRDAANYRGAQRLSADLLVREVDRYLIDAGARPIHISELCERFKVHRRRLHRAFDEVVGLPPITFLRRKRLNDVHTALLLAGPTATVKQIAMEHGFLELGRFSAAYRRMFGELPSTTLRRHLAGFAVWMFAVFCWVSEAS